MNNPDKPASSTSQSALSLNKGVSGAENINKNAISNKLQYKKKKQLNVSELVEGIRNGNISYLSQTITKLESRLPAQRNMGLEILEACLPYSGNSIRIGITGVPGAGKSTFIESFGNSLISKGHKLAVLAIDPSSQRSGGSILGDKTRMEKLAASNQAYIRPSPSGGTLGGVSATTRESMLLCEAAGFDIIIVETVGVGQSETVVDNMVDFFLLLMLAGAGDELQGIKRGIMELADTLVITKADGDNIEKAMWAKASYGTTLHLLPPKHTAWTPISMCCSALEGTGLEEIWSAILNYSAITKADDHWNKKRTQQMQQWMHYQLKAEILATFYEKEDIAGLINNMEMEVANAQISPSSAVKILMQKLFESK